MIGNTRSLNASTSDSCYVKLALYCSIMVCLFFFVSLQHAGLKIIREMAMETM